MGWEIVAEVDFTPLLERYPYGRSLSAACSGHSDSARRLPCKWAYFNGEDTKMEDLNSKGNKNELKGSAKEATGKMRGDLGDATDNADQHAHGRMDQLEGKAQKGLGKVQKALDPDTKDSSRTDR